MTREEVPRSTVTETRELERRQKAQQVEPGELEELWGGRDLFFQQEVFQFDAARSGSAATPSSICLKEVEGSSVETGRLLLFRLLASSLITFTFLSSFHFSLLFALFANISQCLTRIRTN